MAVAELYEAYSDLVLRTCRAILADPHDAEDAAQEVFAKLLERPPDTTVRDPRRWLLEVTRNHCFDRLRAAARRPTVPTQAEPAAGDNAEQRSVARAQLRWLLSLLPDRQREVVVRQAVLDEDLDTVAERLGISYGAAAQLMHRARRAMLHASETARGGIGLVGTPLAVLRDRVRRLALRALGVSRDLAARIPLDAALALPAAALLAGVLAAPPHTAAAAASPVAVRGAPAGAWTAHSAVSTTSGSTVHAGAAVGPASVGVHAHAGGSSAPSGGARVALGDEAHLPPPPPQVSPLLQCLSVEHATVCPPQYPSTIAVNRDTMYAAWLPPTG